MLKKKKIVIAGIGGVGGYFGGLLAKKYSESEEVEIYFFSRGENLIRIQERGMQVLNAGSAILARPKLVTDNANKIGIADYIIVCTKTYDLKIIIDELAPCIDSNTILLPLLNGVDADDQIRNLLPKNTILKGCVYIVAQLKEPGIVEISGNIQSLFFGLDNHTDKRFHYLENIFQGAGIEAKFSKMISKIIWEKFIFISATATATSYFDCSIGKVMDEHFNFLRDLIVEVINIAIAKKIELDVDIIETTLQKLKRLPYDVTSSMHRDRKKRNGKNELEALTGYVVKSGNEYGVRTPFFEKAYQLLKSN